MTSMKRCFNIWDLRNAARTRLPKGVFEYVDKGSEDQLAFNSNLRAFQQVKMLNRVLVDVSDISLKADILGGESAMPLVIAPTGVAGICWYKGELELAKAAAKAGVPFILATGSSTSIEQMAAEAGGRLWFQLYMWREKQLSYELVERAARANFEALVWTVDIGQGANREHNQRNGFSVPYRLNLRSAIDALRHPRWLFSVMGKYLTKGMPSHVNFPPQYQQKFTGTATEAKALRADLVGWDDVDRLREIWPRKLILKGIMRADDAAEAVARGVDAIIVSNHGGRNLDSAPGTLEVLPDILRAVNGRIPVIVDSGVRRGSDIVKCLALGADAVLTGRATLYGVAAGGEKGAAKALTILKNEMRRTMAYVGCRSTREVTSDVLFKGCPADAGRVL
jgi:(S)-mandelate dehydrogenase